MPRDRLSQEDRARLEHMVASAQDAVSIVGRDDAGTLKMDMVRTRALVNCFTEIGEAASKLTEAGRALVGDQPWRQIVGMRNIIVHVYWGIDVAELVKSVQQDLPGLIRALLAALKTAEN